MAPFGRAQVFEQLFQLYEQRLPKRAERDLRKNMWVDQKKYEYRCTAAVSSPSLSHCELPHICPMCVSQLCVCSIRTCACALQPVHQVMASSNPV